jgi:hypothetical protein
VLYPLSYRQVGLPGWIRTNDLSLGRRSNRALQRKSRHDDGDMVQR